jgi:hypothetical protein
LAKYATNISPPTRIRIMGDRLDNLIWKNAWLNHGLVQKNFFWEIKEGRDVLFWDDAWEKEPILGIKNHGQHINMKLHQKGWTHIHYY